MQNALRVGTRMSERRVAFVTGASAGIGAATARALGALGWSVGIGARRTERLEAVAADIDAAGGHAFAHVLDVSDPASLQKFFDAAEQALGPVDVLVNNAGVCHPGLLHEVAPEDLEDELKTNLLGPILLSRLAIKSLLARSAPGDVVFVSSENAVRPRTFQVGYTSTKTGMEAVAAVLRMELERTGIRATVVRPGPTGTEFGHDWEPEVIQRLVESWKYWGLYRYMDSLPPESVAHAVKTVVTAPAGTHFDCIEVMPQPPAET